MIAGTNGEYYSWSTGTMRHTPYCCQLVVQTHIDLIFMWYACTSLSHCVHMCFYDLLHSDDHESTWAHLVGFNHATYLFNQILILFAQSLRRAAALFTSLHTNTFWKASWYVRWSVKNIWHKSQWYSVLGFLPPFELETLEPSDRKRACLIFWLSVMAPRSASFRATSVFHLNRYKSEYHS